MSRKIYAVLTVVAILAFAGTLRAGENELVIEAFYRFEEGEGEMIEDSGPNMYDGIAHKGLFERGGVWVEGKEGKAISFNAEEERYIILPRAVLGETPQKGAIEFWVRPEEEPERAGTIFSKYSTGWRKFFIEYQRGGAIRFTVQGDGVTSTSTTETGNVPLNEWTHVKVTWDGNEGNRVYINGEMRAESEPIEWLGGGLITTVGCQQPIGRDPRIFFTGALDELKIMVEP